LSIEKGFFVLANRVGNRVRPWDSPERTKRNANDDETFLDALSQGDSVARAAAKANYSTRAVYEYREKDEAFAKAWNAAHDAGTDRLEDEAHRRAYSGVKRQVYYKGEVCGVYREFSDGLMRLVLAARRPGKYSNRVLNDQDPDPDKGDVTITIKGGLPKD
jgi:hypothetical protein